MASKKWYILVETNMMSSLESSNALLEKCKVVSLQTFLQNPAQYEDKIEALCGTSGEPLYMHHIQRKEFLDSLPNLRILYSSGAGVDHLLFPDLWNRNIRVGTSGKSFNCTATTELAFLLMMASARKFNQALKVSKVGSDSQIDVFRSQPGVTLEGSTLGIIGMGDIGYKVAQRATAFEMNILYHSRNQQSKEKEENVKAIYCKSLATLLNQSDFVMLCVPLTNNTKHLIGTEELKLMKSSATLINICRGDVVDTDALVVALEQKAISGAALDVTSPEPLPPDHPLLHMANVIVPPHYGGYTQQSCKLGDDIMVESLLAGLEGKPMKHEMAKPIDILKYNKQE